MKCNIYPYGKSWSIHINNVDLVINGVACKTDRSRMNPKLQRHNELVEKFYMDQLCSMNAVGDYVTNDRLYEVDILIDGESIKDGSYISGKDGERYFVYLQDSRIPAKVLRYKLKNFILKIPISIRKYDRIECRFGEVTYGTAVLTIRSKTYKCRH